MKRQKLTEPKDKQQPVAGDNRVRAAQASDQVSALEVQIERAQATRIETLIQEFVNGTRHGFYDIDEIPPEKHQELALRMIQANDGKNATMIGCAIEKGVLSKESIDCKILIDALLDSKTDIEYALGRYIKQAENLPQETAMKIVTAEQILSPLSFICEARMAKHFKPLNYTQLALAYIARDPQNSSWLHSLSTYISDKEMTGLDQEVALKLIGGKSADCVLAEGKPKAFINLDYNEVLAKAIDTDSDFYAHFIWDILRDKNLLNKTLNHSTAMKLLHSDQYKAADTLMLAVKKNKFDDSLDKNEIITTILDEYPETNDFDKFTLLQCWAEDLSEPVRTRLQASVDLYEETRKAARNNG